MLTFLIYVLTSIFVFICGCIAYTYRAYKARSSYQQYSTLNTPQLRNSKIYRLRNAVRDYIDTHNAEPTHLFCSGRFLIELLVDIYDSPYHDPSITLIYANPYVHIDDVENKIRVNSSLLSLYIVDSSEPNDFFMVGKVDAYVNYKFTQLFTEQDN